jgi:hypothetical protein
MHLLVVSATIVRPGAGPLQAIANRSGAEPMDLSKLPKLSDTKAAESAAAPPADPMPVATAPPAPAPVYREPAAPPRPVGVGVDVWISTVIGLLFVFMGLQFARFAMAKVTHRPFHSDPVYTWPDDDPRAGQEVAYFDLQGYVAWTEMCAFLFGLTLLFEAASKAAIAIRPGSVSRAVLVLAIVLTVATVVLNLYACALLMKSQITPLLSGIAVAFGGWVLFDEVNTLQATRRRPTAAGT